MPLTSSILPPLPANATPAQIAAHQLQFGGTAQDHHNHFHVYLRPPAAVSITGGTQNLLADNGAMDQTQGVASDALRAAAQALLDQVQPQLNLDQGQGDVIMFALDMPDVPPQYTPVMIAQATQTQTGNTKTDRTVGVCHLLENPAFPPIPGATTSAYNSLSPVLATKNYFYSGENRTVDGPSTVTVLVNPKHGKLDDLGTIVFDENGRAIRDTGERSYSYIPAPGYLGQDSATLLVEIGSFKIKLIYFFHVEKGPLDFKLEDVVCPPPRVWKISLNPDDPKSPIYTFSHPDQLTS